MINLYCNGFLMAEEKDLIKLGSIDEYLDLLHGKNEYSYDEERWTEEVGLLSDDEEHEVDDAWDLGHDLYIARALNRITQKQLSEQIGISISTIAKLEKGLFPRKKGQRIHVQERNKMIVEEYVNNNLE